jgi:pimeloyl-ACP methyl ester carboxylesterase
MAGDVERFVEDHNLNNVVLAGHSMYLPLTLDSNIRGAKVALYLSLTKPDLPRGIISMENAPISSRLSPTFKKYVEAMKAITEAKLTKRKDAEDLLTKYEEVRPKDTSPI